MSEWTQKVLNDLLVDATSGFACGENLDEGIFQFRMNNVTIDGQLDLSKRRRVPSEYPNIERYLLQTGDVLFNTTNSPDLVGKSAFFPGLDEAVVFSNHFLRLRPRKDELDGRYLSRWLNLEFHRGKFRGMCRQWVNQATVSRDALLGMMIPIPSLSEQQRIADILDKVDALQGKRRATLTLLDTLIQSIFFDMFGDPTLNHRKWPQQQLNTFFNFRTGKLDSNAAELDGRYPFFTCSQENLRINTFAFDCEALLLAGNNATANYSVKHYKGKFNAYQRTYVITLQNKKNSYAYARFVLENWLTELKRISKGTNTKYLTLELLNRIQVPVPPKELQEQFEYCAAKVEREKRVHAIALSQLEDLFDSLQSRAFRGEL